MMHGYRTGPNDEARVRDRTRAFPNAAGGRRQDEPDGEVSAGP